jgi:hypothetical protein
MVHKIDLENVRSKRYDDNVERHGEFSNTCFLCGKPTAEKLHVHYTTDGMLIDTTDDSEETNSQGFFPIGSECAKKLPKKFVFGN